MLFKNIYKATIISEYYYVQVTRNPPFRNTERINNTLFFRKEYLSHISANFGNYFLIMHLLRYALVVLVFSLALTPALAQSPSGIISGRLTDSKNKPVSYATVTLLRSDSSVANGDLSKDDGSFNIGPVSPGNYHLRVESIGYETKFVSLQTTAAQPDKNMGGVQLKETENTLKGVSIVGEKAVMELKVDKKVFNVEKNTTTAGGSAADVLQNVPSVSVDADGNVSLRGRSDVTILIDGKPATMLGTDVASALKTLAASSIENVEVITNPSAKYDAQGTGGIINIITKKDGRLGINGNFTLGAGTRDKYNGNVGLNVRKGKWNTFLNSSFRLNRTFNDVITDRHDKDTALTYHTLEHVPRVFNGTFHTIGATFDPDKYNSITVTENINLMEFKFADNSDYNIYKQPNEAPFYHQDRYSTFSGGPFSLSSAVDYKRKFRKKDEELSVDFSYANTRMNRFQDYTTPTDTLILKERAPGTGGNNTLNAWADYTDPLFTKNGKLGLGFKSQVYNFNSTNEPIVDSFLLNGIKKGEGIDNSLQSSYSYTQQIHAAYVNWNDQLGNFSYQAGLRVEDAIYDGHGKVPYDTSFHNSFSNFFPSAFISYQLKNQQSVYLNYSRRTNRPGFMQLLPFVDKSNPSTVNTGNPALLPEFINNLEFSYNKADNKGNNIILSAYYAQTENLTQKITRNLTPQEVIKYNVSPSELFTQPINIASGTTYGLEGTGHLQLLPIWEATLNVNFFQNMLHIGSIDTSIKNLNNTNGSSWFGKINTSLKLPRSFSLQINANYESPKVIAQGSVNESWWVDVALKKTFWKNKASLVINCSDIFKTHVYVINYDYYTYAETINRIRETRIGNITFTYRFGKSDVGKNFANGNGGKRGKAKIEKPSDEDRQKNLKDGDDDQPGGGGGMQGAGNGQKKDNGGGR